MFEALKEFDTADTNNRGDIDYGFGRPAARKRRSFWFPYSTPGDTARALLDVSKEYNQGHCTLLVFLEKHAII